MSFTSTYEKDHYHILKYYINPFQPSLGEY